MKRHELFGWTVFAVTVCILVAIGLRSGHIQYLISDILAL